MSCSKEENLYTYCFWNFFFVFFEVNCYGSLEKRDFLNEADFLFVGFVTFFTFVLSADLKADVYFLTVICWTLALFSIIYLILYISFMPSWSGVANGKDCVYYTSFYEFFADFSLLFLLPLEWLDFSIFSLI